MTARPGEDGPARVRALALGLPEVTEQDHHGRASFRVSGRIFATLPDDEHVNVMLDEDGIRTYADARPDACTAVWWGKRLAATQVVLSRVDTPLLRELLTDAWQRKAPRRLSVDRGSDETG